MRFELMFGTRQSSTTPSFYIIISPISLLSIVLSLSTTMSKSLHDSSFSLSKRYSNWKNKLQSHENQQQIPSFTEPNQTKSDKKPSKLRAAINALTRFRPNPNRVVVGTLYGYRRGHVHFAIQENPKQNPTLLIELSTATSGLVQEMGSGSVRVALECEKKGKKGCDLAEEGLWRAYCNGKKCGFATRREIGAEERRILAAVEPITMGAGVLPAAEGDLMFMRARFERVVGSKDSEAFYMIGPDRNGGPELSVYLLRV